MATLSIRFPNSLHDAVKDLASKDNISINQFVTSAVIEKITAMETQNYLEQRASSGSEQEYRAFLQMVPSAPPMKGDEFLEA